MTTAARRRGAARRAAARGLGRCPAGARAVLDALGEAWPRNAPKVPQGAHEPQKGGTDAQDCQRRDHEATRGTRGGRP